MVFPKVVVQKNQSVERFNARRIYDSIRRETGLQDSQAREITDRVLKRLDNNDESVSSQFIRELVGYELDKIGLKHKYKRIGIPVYDLDNLYMFGSFENSNQSLCPEALHTWIADYIVEEYVLTKFGDLSVFHRDGVIHIHMLRYWDRPFCQEWDLRMIMAHGIPPVHSTAMSCSSPAKSALVAATHAAKWLGLVQGEFSGGQGYDHFTTILAPYLRGLGWEEILQVAQCFVYESNQIFASRGGQASFTSISCTPYISKEFVNLPAIGPGGKVCGTYGEYAEECRLLFRALCDIYSKGDRNGVPFSFPKFEVKISKYGLENFEEEYRYVIDKVASVNGSVYFLNQCGWLPEEIHSQCCRILFDKNEFIKYCDDVSKFDYSTHFVTLGSLQSVSLNLPYISGISIEEKKDWKEVLSYYMEISKQILLQKYDYIKKRVEAQNAFLFLGKDVDGVFGTDIAKQPLFDFDRQSLSIGFVGLNEFVEILTQGVENLTTLNGHKIGAEVLEFLDKKCLEFSSKCHIKFSLWEQPAESTANRFAKKFLERFPGMVSYVRGSGEGVYFTNSAHIPYDDVLSLDKRISLQGEYHPIVKGGVITHVWLGDKKADPDALWELTKKICLNTDTAYFAYSFDFTICNDCGKVVLGEKKECVGCGGDNVDYVARITGYYSRVSRWNHGKKQEFKDRIRETVG